MMPKGSCPWHDSLIKRLIKRTFDDIHLTHVKFMSICWATTMKQSPSPIHLYYSCVYASTHSSMQHANNYWMVTLMTRASVHPHQFWQASDKQDTIRRYLWHWYIHHTTSSSDEARQIFGQVFMRLSHYSTDTSPHNGIKHIIIGHRQGEGDTTVREDEDRHTHGWAPPRQKPSFSLIERCWAPMRRRWHFHSSKWIPAYIWLDTDEVKVILFISTSRLHPMWRRHCYDCVSAIQNPPSYIEASNTLHEDMTTIARSLIRGFLQTRSIDVINRVSSSHKAPGIGKLRYSWKQNIEDNRRIKFAHICGEESCISLIM
jgi:hypothetical protein